MKKRPILFIDRDGTLIIEPPQTFQVDRLDKLQIIEDAGFVLSKIQKEFDYLYVMVTNQDGLGTESFPEEDFWPPHNEMLRLFEIQGIKFDDVLIDKSREEDMAPTRKPRTGLVTSYIKGEYDLARSFVIGDRLTDMQFAQNIGCKGIWLNLSTPLPNPLQKVVSLRTKSWRDIYQFLKHQS